MRYVVLLLLVVIPGLAFTRWRSAGSDASPNPERRVNYSVEEMQAIFDRQEELELARQARHRFAVELEATRHQLWQGTMDLPGAVRAVLISARCHGHPFLKFLPDQRPEVSDELRVASSLAAHLKSDLEIRLVPERFVPSVRRALADYEAWNLAASAGPPPARNRRVPEN